MLSPYVSDFVVKIMILSIFALSLELLVGMTGLVSLGHAAFYGIGAYATVLGSGKDGGSIALLLPLAMGCAAAYALVVGALSLRTRGVYFIMVTLAFAQMAFFVFHDTKLGGGSDGIYMYIRPALGALDMENRYVQFYVVLAALVFTYGLLALIRRSRFGAALAGIRVNEQRMRAAGFPVYGYKLAAFVHRRRAGRAGGLPAGLARRRGQPRAAGLAQLGRGAADDHPGRPRPPARRGDRRRRLHAAEGTAVHACPGRAAGRPLAADAGPGHHRLRGAAAQGPRSASRRGCRPRGQGRQGDERMTTLLAVETLTRRFGGLVAVNAVTLDLRRGEVHAVIGTNGAGKSTLINMLSGEIAASDGRIALDGEDITTRAAVAPRARRRRPQLPAHHDLPGVHGARELPPGGAGRDAAALGDLAVVAALRRPAMPRRDEALAARRPRGRGRSASPAR